MNVLDLLLNTDEKNIKIPTKQVEIKRLSADLGNKIVFTCQAVSPDKMEEIQENALTVKGKEVDVDIAEVQIFTVIEGVKEPNFRNKELQKKFDAHTPKDLVKKLLLAGEITRLYNVISDLSGFGEEAVAEVKN